MGDSEYIYVQSDPSGDGQFGVLHSNKPAFTEILDSWMHYLQMLNGLCTAGARVSAAIRNFNYTEHSQDGATDWDEPARAMLASTALARTRALLIFQYLETCRRDSNPIDEIHHQLISENIMSVIHLHYGFIMATTERLTNISISSCWKPPIEHQEREIVVPRMACFSPSIPPRIQEMASESEPWSYPAESPVAPYEYHRTHHVPCEIPQCYCHTNIDTKIYRNRPINTGDRSQISQESSSSSDGLHSMYGYPRSFYNPGVGVGPAPSVGCEFLRGPNTFFGDNLSYAPSHGDSLSGPFPAPGTLASAKGPFQKTGRIGIHRSTLSKLQPVQPRRWSEAAAHEIWVREEEGPNARRWSVPWDGGPPPPPPQMHNETPDYWKDSSNGSAPDGVLTGDCEALAAAILLLSCRPPQTGTEAASVAAAAPAAQHSTIPQETPRGYSMWSGSDALPFLRLPESREPSYENLQPPI